LKCSHLFNVLDTRGAIGVTERAKYFQRMRNIARQVSEAYIEQRQRLEYPFFDVEGWQQVKEGAEALKPALTPYKTAQTFVLEIGSEELPASDLTSAVRQLRIYVPELLDKLRLGHGQVIIDGTPRRLAVIVEDVQPRQDDLETEVKGPPADRAFDAQGKPTKAAEGFARSRGVSVDDLKVVEEKGGRYVTAVVREEGRPAVEVLSENLADLVASIKFEKSMRWNDSGISFSRPLRWLLALYGEDIVPSSYAGVTSGQTSRGIRPYGSPPIEVSDAASYAGAMRENKIILDTDERQQAILEGVTALAAEKSGTIPGDVGLLEEVTNLVECPTPLLGEFERRFLSLPEEVLVAVMRKHQRYFPVYAQNGRLLPYFIAVRNGDEEHLDIVREGNEHVIRARFADAEFFYNNDIKKKLTDFLPELDKLTFQADLGSMLAKTERLERLVPEVAEMLDLDEADVAAAARAAALAKADLATSMVVEMTSLQGIMGGHYAGLSGEAEPMIAAIAEQYDAVSKTKPGLALALADRLDSLLGLFGAGLAPKGSNDPFALRRAAIQIIENLVGNEQHLDLRAALAEAAPLLPIEAGKAVQEDVLQFINGRLAVSLREDGFSSSVIKAVVAEAGHDPYLAWRNAADLSAAIEAEDWQEVLNAYARCVRITRNLDEVYAVDAGAFSEPAEQSLWAAYQEAAETADGSMPALIASLRGLVPAINRFFDDILVMAEDAQTRENRLALLQHIANLPDGMADLSELEGF
jgi:glycyl-tRNA synthetase